MSTAELLKPILESGIRSVNFFNGRLLSGEDMSREQLANREARKLIGQAVGDGVAYGLEVIKTPGAGTSPRLTVQPGLALNRCGEPLRLSAAADLSLVRPQNESAAIAGSFADCTPFQAGTYVSGSGVYLLVLCPAKGTEGRAPMSGLGNDPVDCNTKYTVDGVQFRLVQLDLSPTELNDQNHLRSLVAYKCFGIAQLKPLLTAPFGAASETYGLLDQLRPNRLTDCDVPLAVFFWTATQGIRFVDTWSVRRRLIEPSAVDEWTASVGDRRRSESEATLMQFQDALDSIKAGAGLGGAPQPAQITADQHFAFLPPAGFLPTGAGGFDWKKFLGPHAPDQSTLIDEGLFRSAVHRSLFQDPFKIVSFATAAQANTAPPIPLSVYKLPGQSNFVLFARSWNGRVRVFLNPAPAASEQAEINASSKTGNAVFNAVAVTGGMRPIISVPPGPHKINATIQGYQPVTPIGVNVIGGETLDVSINIIKLPNGRILLSVNDETGASIAQRVTSVTAVSLQGNITRTGVLVSGKWSLQDLPAGSYNVTVAVPGFRPGTLTGVPVALGETVNRTIVMVRTTGDRPPLCVSISNVKRPLLQKARLCIVLSGKATIGTQTKRTAQRRASNAGEVFREDFELESRRAEDFVAVGGPPWADMVQLEPVSSDVGKWLAAWQQWFNKQFPGQGIGDAKPAIFLDPKYVPPKTLRDVPDSPQAYAVFGKFARPMTINISTNTTNRPVTTKKAKIRGIGDDDWAQLDRYGIRYIDQVAGLWSDYLSNITGQSLDSSRFLILDSISAVDDVNKTKTYYEGWDAEVATVVREMGLTDDVAVANADRAELSRRLGAGFANRLIEQGREIVPREAWSLETLGLTKGQVASLADQGIASKGELVGSTTNEAGAGKVAGIVGIQTGEVLVLRETAVSQITAASVTLAPTKEITLLRGMNPEVSEKLGSADITSTEALAGSDKTELAAKTGLTEDAAGELIESAKAEARSNLDVGLLPAISAENAEVLKTSLGVRTVADLAGKEPSAIAAAFGGDLRKASAVIAGAKAGLGRFRR